MRLRLELPDLGIVAGAVLYERAAPTVARLVFGALEQPLETHTQHACFDGHEVYCFLPPFSKEPPLENRTMRPDRGALMFFYAPPNAFVATADDRLSGGNPAVHELAFMYGEVDLRHYWEEGFHGSLVGSIDDNLEGFAAGCGRTLAEGRTRFVISREER